jgi:signal transduction histidine kinase
MSRAARPRRATVVAAAAALTAQVALGWFALQGEYFQLTRPPVPAFVVDLVAGVLALGLLALAPRFPVRVGFATAALLTVSAATTPIAGTAALWVAQRRRLPVAIAVAVTGVLAHLVRGFWRPVQDRPLGLWMIFIVAAYAAIVGWGAMRQARTALICSLEERAARAESEQAARLAEARLAERNRIAREMHDVLAHRLSLLAAYAGAVEFRPDAPREDLARAASVVRSGAHQALEELRGVIGVLRGSDPDDPDRPQPTLADVRRLLDETRDAGTAVTLDDRIAAPEEVPDALGRTVYRIVQEALTNARKHAAGQPVSVILAGRPGRRLAVLVENPLGPGSGTPGGGTGLVGVRERVELAGGRLGTADARGRFRVWASLPWPA